MQIFQFLSIRPNIVIFKEAYFYVVQNADLES